MYCQCTCCVRLVEEECTSQLYHVVGTIARLPLCSGGSREPASKSLRFCVTPLQAHFIPRALLLPVTFHPFILLISFLPSSSSDLSACLLFFPPSSTYHLHPRPPSMRGEQTSQIDLLTLHSDSTFVISPPPL